MEHKSISIADQIFEKLEQEILSGVYRRGDILTEARLCEQLGVSRTPVREALRRLDQEHIVQITPKGVLVVGISKQDIQDIYEIRLRIEGMVARFAAERADEESIAEINRILELQEFYVTKQNADGIKNMDSAFHALVYQMSHSTPLCDTLTELHKKVLKYRRFSIEHSGRAALSVKEHRRIADAIVARDSDAAEAAMIEHIKNARVHIDETESFQ